LESRQYQVFKRTIRKIHPETCKKKTNKTGFTAAIREACEEVMKER
jgi:hypothetical protein